MNFLKTLQGFLKIAAFAAKWTANPEDDMIVDWLQKLVDQWLVVPPTAAQLTAATPVLGIQGPVNV